MKRVAVWGSLILALMACSRFDEQEIFETKELVFTATREESDTKTVRVGTDVLWSPGDAISIFFRSGDNGGSKFTAQNTTENVAIAQFKGTIDVLSGGGESEDGEFWFWGIYPYSSQNSCDGSSITTVIPTQQTGKAGTFADNTFITMARSKGLNLAFYNICSGVKFTLTRDDIKEVRIRGNNGEDIAGKIKAVWDANGKPAITEYIEGAKEVSVTAPGGGTFATGTEYYLVLAPTLFTGGFTMSIKTSDDKLGMFVYENSRQFKRGIFINVSDLDTRVTSWIDVAAKAVPEEGGEVELEVLSNESCHAVIPAEAQSWISEVPSTKAVEKKTITLVVEANIGLPRSATVDIVRDSDSAVLLSHTVCQGGGGVWKGGTIPPDDEIWYTTKNNAILNLEESYPLHYPYPSQPFDSNVISHTYENGKGVIKCDGPITVIFDYVFGSHLGNSINHIFLPNSIRILHTGALQGIDVDELRIPDNLQAVGSKALNSNSIKHFTGNHTSPDGRCVIIEDACYEMGGTLVSAHNYMAAFAPSGLSEYSLPDQVEILGYYVFAWCPELRKISFNEGLKEILGDCFVDVNLDCDIILPSTLERLDPYAFRSCNGIKGFYGNEKFHTSDHYCLTFEQTVSTPEKNGTWINRFVGNSLEHYAIPDGIKGIENYTFDGLTNLKSITIPASVLTIGSAAFSNCSALEAIYGPYASNDHRSAVIDEELVLIAANGLKTYKTPDNISTVSGWKLMNLLDVEEITISDNLTQIIDSYAFRLCPNLKTITLSASLSSLGYDPFSSSPKIEIVYCRSILPPIVQGNGFFDNREVIIYVPKQSVELYKESPFWCNYKDNIAPFEYTDLPEIDFYFSNDYTANGTTFTLQQSSTGSGIDLVLMGDAFSDRQIADGTYGTVMQNAMNAFFSEEPYKSMKDRFNVYTVNVVSATEGYEHSGQALSTGHGDGTYVYGNDSKVIKYAKNAIGEDRLDDALIIVMMNEDAYAGTCFMYNPPSGNYGRGLSIAYFPVSSDTDTFNGLVSHEAGGHGFAKLADEYAYEYMGAISDDAIADTKVNEPYGWWKNVDFTSDPVLVKWSQFLADDRYANEGLGCYEGGLTYWSGVWRPTDASIMRYNTGGFNAPSRYAIWYRIGKLAYGENWEGSYEDFVTYDAVNRTPAAIQRRNAQRRNYVEKPLPQLPAPVVVGHSWREELEKGR